MATLHVSIDELRRHMSDTLAHVTLLGGEVVLTSHGKPVARLCPLPGDAIGADRTDVAFAVQTSPDGDETPVNARLERTV